MYLGLTRYWTPRLPLWARPVDLDPPAVTAGARTATPPKLAPPKPVPKPSPAVTPAPTPVIIAHPTTVTPAAGARPATPTPSPPPPVSPVGPPGLVAAPVRIVPPTPSGKVILPPPRSALPPPPFVTPSPRPPISPVGPPKWSVAAPPSAAVSFQLWYYTAPSGITYALPGPSPFPPGLPRVAPTWPASPSVPVVLASRRPVVTPPSAPAVVVPLPIPAQAFRAAPPAIAVPGAARAAPEVPSAPMPVAPVITREPVVVVAPAPVYIPGPRGIPEVVLLPRRPSAEAQEAARRFALSRALHVLPPAGRQALQMSLIPFLPPFPYRRRRPPLQAAREEYDQAMSALSGGFPPYQD